MRPLHHQEPSALTDFRAWIQSADGAAFHAALVGWPEPLQTRQVQVSRMEVGESFPKHRTRTRRGSPSSTTSRARGRTASAAASPSGIPKWTRT
nr:MULTISPECIES: hypothetical protein [unclassified Corallococcus]